MNGSMDARHETIHQAIHVQGKGEPRPQLKHAMRRARRRTRAGRHHQQDADAARTAAQQPGMGPGPRTRPAYTRVRRARHAGALPRPPRPLAARHQREHQRLAAPALPQGNRPARTHRGTPRRSRHGTQRQAPQAPGPHETQREDPRTDRRHRNINTNRHHQHQPPKKMLQQPLEFTGSTGPSGHHNCMMRRTPNRTPPTTQQAANPCTDDPHLHNA